MKLFTAKSHVRATLRKLWRQTGCSLPLPAKCSPLLHVIRAGSWRWPDVVAEISACFVKENFFCFISFIKKVCLFDPFLLLYIKSLSDLSFWEQSNLMFPSASSREALGFSETKFTVPFGTNHYVYRHWWDLGFQFQLSLFRLSRNKTSTAIVWFLVTCTWSDDLMSPNWNAIVQLLPARRIQQHVISALVWSSACAQVSLIFEFESHS